jgi:hypothetical protein
MFFWLDARKRIAVAPARMDRHLNGSIDPASTYRESGMASIKNCSSGSLCTVLESIPGSVVIAAR